MLSKGELDHACFGRVFHNIQANTSHGTRTRPQNLKSLFSRSKDFFGGVKFTNWTRDRYHAYLGVPNSGQLSLASLRGRLIEYQLRLG